jgi:hypothetical protein
MKMNILYVTSVIEILEHFTNIKNPYTKEKYMRGKICVSIVGEKENE